MENPDGFDELKYYIMTSIEELKKKFDSLEDQVHRWRQQSLAEIVEIKTKISLYASLIALLISASVSVVVAMVLK